MAEGLIKMPPLPVYTGKLDTVWDKIALALQSLRLKLKKDYDPRPVFILGTGRSGTHWVGWILEAHPEIRALIEKPPLFEWSTMMALDPNLEPYFFDHMVQRYKLECLRSNARILVDKSHPNIWQAEKLQQQFPNARFLGVLRGVEATVASMLRHEGVRYWVEHWDDYPYPNRLLGSGEVDHDVYAQMSITERCTVRWLAHKNRLDLLPSLLGDGYHRIDYDGLQEHTEETLALLQCFLRLKRRIPTPTVNRKSADRWKQDLDAIQIDQIKRVLNAYGHCN